VQIPEEKINSLSENVPVWVGEQIKKFRQSKKMTQTELAHRIWKDRQYLYKIEKGKVTPNIHTISLIALALDISLSELLDEIKLDT